MALVLTRRLLSRNLLKINEFSNLAAYSCMHINLSTLDNKKRSYFNNNDRFKVALCLPNKYCYVSYSTHDKKNEEDKVEQKEKKLSLFQKFKIMYRDYWYVLLPVHIVTSVVWFGGFYFMAKSGIDIVAILESWHVNQRLINPLKDSSMGYVAVAYALYKIATPARYTVTLGGTTVSINYLRKWGYIKPVPSKERMKAIYEEKKETLSKSMKETKEGIIETKDTLIETVRETKVGIIEKKDTLIESLDETKKGLKEKKDNIVGTVKTTKEILKKGKIGIKNKMSK